MSKLEAFNSDIAWLKASQSDATGTGLMSCVTLVNITML